MSAPDQRFALLRCGVTPSPAIVGARRVDVAPPDDLTPTKMMSSECPKEHNTTTNTIQHEHDK